MPGQLGLRGATLGFQCEARRRCEFSKACDVIAEALQNIVLEAKSSRPEAIDASREDA